VNFVLFLLPGKAIGAKGARQQTEHCQQKGSDAHA